RTTRRDHAASVMTGQEGKASKELDDLHLVAFMTRNMSLEAWAKNGSLGRETAFHRAIRPSLGAVTLVTFGGREDIAIGAEFLPGIEVVCNRVGMPAAWYHRYLRHFWARRQLVGKTTIVRTNQMPGASLATDVAVAGGACFLARLGYLHSFNIEQRTGQASVAAERARSEERYAVERADHVVVTTARIREMMIEQYGIAPSMISIIPNYVDGTLFQPRSQEVRERPPRLLYIGRLEAEKNPHLLIEAASRLETPVEVVMIGEGPARDELETRAAELGVTLDLVGRLPNADLPARIHDADIFVLASNYEGHPKALIEAMASGKAVVGTDVPGIRDVIRHGENGLLCEKTPAALAAALTELLGSAALRQELGDVAAEEVKATLMLDQVVDLELDLYTKLLQPKKGLCRHAG
ncbi:MAG: glycosyltransferase family 4 protein, partial [Geminicoccaceae bacterium]